MVIWSDPARDDLKQIHDYISLESHYYAQIVASTIIEKTDDLNNFPDMGRVVPEINKENIREIFSYSYRIIYEKSNDAIIIHAVIHGKRDLDEEFLKDK